MNLPYKKLVVPSALKTHKNGQLPSNLLAKVSTGGLMYAPVAAQFNLLYAEALKAGHKLKNIGDYRSFDGQLKMFMERYDTTDRGRSPQVTRQYDGKTWYLKPGCAPSAAPDPTGLKGSNHGWGLAIDLAFEQNGKTVAMGGACFDWLCANAPRFGFYLQTDDRKSKEFEAWHWQYALGDAAPSGQPVNAPVAAAPAAGGLPYPGVPLKLGTKGEQVKHVQRVVGAAPDGGFGPKTEQSVMAWQRANGLKPDGVVGPVTWAKMFP